MFRVCKGMGFIEIVEIEIEGIGFIEIENMFRVWVQVIGLKTSF